MWGLCAVFQEEWVAMRSLQKSSPNSCCNSPFHAFGELSGLMKLDALEHFSGWSKFSNGVESGNKSGLWIGDGVYQSAVEEGADPMDI
jgi:hypothetical protein